MAEVDPFDGNEFTADTYLAAGIEHAGLLQSLYDERRYVWALYVSGVAVESMLRAYRFRFDTQFDSRHNLHELAKDSRIAEYVPEAAQDQYAALLSGVALRWSNNHRYRTEDMIRRRFKRARLDRRVRGDYLKENTRITVNAAISLVQLGVTLWKN